MSLHLEAFTFIDATFTLLIVAFTFIWIVSLSYRVIEIDYTLHKIRYCKKYDLMHYIIVMVNYIYTNDGECLMSSDYWWEHWV